MHDDLKKKFDSGALKRVAHPFENINTHAFAMPGVEPPMPPLLVIDLLKGQPEELWVTPVFRPSASKLQTKKVEDAGQKTGDLPPGEPPPLTPCSCGCTCCFEGWNEGEPCYGKVMVVDIDCPEDPELRTEIHGCEGHENGYGKYTPFRVS